MKARERARRMIERVRAGALRRDAGGQAIRLGEIAPPLTLGGQGRAAESVESDAAVCALCGGGVALMVLASVLCEMPNYLTR